LTARKELLNKFLKTIGVNKSISETDERNINDIFDRFSKGPLDRMQEAFAKPIDTFGTREEYQDARTGTSLLQEESGLLNDIVDVINNHYQLAETHSFMRGDGKKAFGWIDASYQSGILSAVTRAFSNRSSRKFNTFSVNSGKLETNDRFLKDNILFNGMSFIKGFIDHDSIKREDDPKRAKYLTKENLTDFEERHVIFGFLERLKSTHGDRYYQFLPIPSNRTTIQAVDVKLQKGKEQERALKQIIKAQKNRPALSKHADLAEVESYAANYNKWKLAGLEGTVDSLTEAQALEKVTEHVAKQVAEISEMYMQKEWGKFPPVRIPDANLEYAANLFGLGAVPSLAITEQTTDKEKQDFLDAKNKIIEGVLKNFYYNFIINQYSVSQLLYGDETFYNSKEDQTKRIQMVTATGDTLLVDDNYGVPKVSKILVVDDLSRSIPSDLQGAIASSYREGYEASDAEGFMLPEFYEKIARAYGIEAATDIVMKPVYFSIENGIPVAVKYSVKVLTDELVDKFPHLASYRDAMRKVGADQMTFRSAVKLGKIKTTGKLDPSNGKIIANSATTDALLTLNTENLRFQLNPSHNPDVDVANLSQGTAFINTNGQNPGEAFKLHGFNASVINNGLRRISRELRLTEKGSMTPASKELLRRKTLSQVEGVPGGADVEQILKATHPVTGEAASLSLPLIADRVVSSIASMISKATVGFRFPGSKLILQADLGKQEL